MVYITFLSFCLTHFLHIIILLHCLLLTHSVINHEETRRLQSSSSSSSGQIVHSATDYIRPGNCKKLWRPDSLPGKCFGLKLHTEFPELKSISKVKNAKECRAICCNLGDKCVSWQFQNSTGECRLGPPVRLGLEGADTPDWCDPHPPSTWNGYRVSSRNTDNSCKWGEQLPNQCFGFGPEKMNSTEGHMNAKECGEACCQSNNCNMWQEMPGRGCYFGSSEAVWCDKPQGAFEGGRKCVPDFCGGLENTILPAHNKYLETLKSATA